jgi:hypothetical protein
MDKPHIYDLSFLPSRKKGKEKAEFVFSIRTEEMPELLRRLERILSHSSETVHEYFGRPHEFAFEGDDLFGGVGFGRCARFTHEDDRTLLHVEVGKGEATPFTAQTMHMIFYALSSPLQEGVKRNRLQLIDIMTSCERGMPYGHAVTGHISSTIFRTLVQRAAKTHEDTPLPKSVIAAMKNAWLAGGGAQLLVKYCGGFFSPDGRFILRCPGNACDIAIYPDNVYDASGVHGTDFSCHNLDTALQQITLLAGLVTLVQTVEKEEW